jgi:hypothetical protein
VLKAQPESSQTRHIVARTILPHPGPLPSTLRSITLTRFPRRMEQLVDPKIVAMPCYGGRAGRGGIVVRCFVTTSDHSQFMAAMYSNSRNRAFHGCSATITRQRARRVAGQNRKNFGCAANFVRPAQAVDVRLKRRHGPIGAALYLIPPGSSIP